MQRFVLSHATTMIRALTLASLITAAALHAAPTAAPANAPRANAKGASDAVAFHDFLNRRLAGFDLEYAPVDNQYFAAVKVNGKDARFQVDSGSTRSIFARRALAKLGLTARESNLVAQGIGGTETAGLARFETFSVGPHIAVPSRELLVLDIGARNGADGLVGADTLRAAKVYIDHRNHRFLYAATNDAVDVAAKARETGMAVVALRAAGGQTMIDATVNGKPARFLLDTGAQQSVLDAALARKLGITAIDSSHQVAGVGANAASLQVATVNDLAVGPAHVRRAPMLVMSLAGLRNDANEKIDGVLGAEFLYATGAVIDNGAMRLFLEPREFRLAEFSKLGGEMYDSDAALKKAFDAAPWVARAHIMTATPMPQIKIKDRDGAAWIGAELVAVIDENLKGAARPVGAEHRFKVLIPDGPNPKTQILGLFGRNSDKILFLTPDAAGEPAPYSSCVWTDGVLPRAQLARIRATGTTKR